MCKITLWITTNHSFDSNERHYLADLYLSPPGGMWSVIPWKLILE